MWRPVFRLAITWRKGIAIAFNLYMSACWETQIFPRTSREIRSSFALLIQARKELFTMGKKVLCGYGIDLDAVSSWYVRHDKLGLVRAVLTWTNV